MEVQVTRLERIKCSMCENDFGQEKRFYKHLLDEHDIDDLEQHYVDVHNLGHKQQCGCGCGKPVKWAGWKKGYTSKFLRGHNASMDSCFLDQKKQADIAKKRSEGYASGRLTTWNKGLTKETSASVKSQSVNVSKTLTQVHKDGSIINWRVANPEKSIQAAKKSSETKKKNYASGQTVSWNQGLTKETHSSIASASKKISERYSKPNAGNRIKIGELKERISIHDGFELLSDLETEYKKRRVERLRFKCKTCNNTCFKSLAMLEDCPVCFHCHPKESKGQIEVFEFVRSLCPDAVISDRKLIAPKEVDVYVPSKKLAIEYHGLFWHSDQVIKDEAYTQNKLELCREKGVSLFVVFEDEWRDRQAIVKSMIRHRLGLTTNRIHARMCDVRELPVKVANEFLEHAHLEGGCRAKVAFGLFHAGVLVGCMTLRRPFHRKYAGCLEVARSALAPNTSVPGWLGRLTKRALLYCNERGISDGLMTYVDARLGGGTPSYASAGWKVVSNTRSPRFWWTDFYDRFNRFKFRADKSRNLSQREVAEMNGVSKLFGCTNSVMKVNQQ